MVKRVMLRNKKGYLAPAVFFHIHSMKYDPQAIWEANENYPRAEDQDGIRSIDGFLVESKDWDTVEEKLALRQEVFSQSRAIRDRVLIMDPALDLAIRGSKVDKKKMWKTGLFDPKFTDAIEAIGSDPDIKSNTKVDRVISDAYRHLDAGTVRDFVKRQIDGHADFVIPPIVPITSTRQIDRQCAKAIEIMRETKVLMNTVFNRYSESIDMMNLLTINAPVLKPENYNKLIALALSFSPTHIGIRVVNLATSNDSQMKAIVTFMKQLHGALRLNNLDTAIHMINFDHLGYSMFCLGAQTVTMPIGTDPYFYGRIESDELPEKDGVYYVMDSMSYLRPDDLEDELIEKDFILPCYCELCQNLRTLQTARKTFKEWNYFRRMHEILARDLEVKQLREAKVPLCRAISDKLARSTKSNYLSLIPFEPIIRV